MASRKRRCWAEVSAGMMRLAVMCCSVVPQLHRRNLWMMVISVNERKLSKRFV